MKTFLGALKSQTMWLGLGVAVAPYGDQLIGIAAGISPLAGGVLAGLIWYCRYRTSKPLSEK